MSGGVSPCSLRGTDLELLVHSPVSMLCQLSKAGTAPLASLWVWKAALPVRTSQSLNGSVSWEGTSELLWNSVNPHQRLAGNGTRGGL